MPPDFCPKNPPKEARAPITRETGAFAILGPLNKEHGMAWIAQILFFGSYFAAWVVGAFDPLTVTSKGHTAIVITALAALVLAFLTAFDNRGVLERHPKA